jgi:hypothetical protein
MDPGSLLGSEDADMNRITHKLFAISLLLAGLVHGARAQSEIVGWGITTFDSGWNDDAFAEIAAGQMHSVARRADGSLVAWGDNTDGQCSLPAFPGGFGCVEVAAGARHSVARRSDGSVVAWGSNAAGQCGVPALPIGLAWLEIAAGEEHSLARRSDG